MIDIESGVCVDKDRFDESLQSLAARRRAAEGHPSPDVLVAYRAGDLTAEQDERIKDHLAICRECSQLVLDLAEFEELEPRETIAAVDVQAEEAWQRLRPKLAAEAAPAGAQPVDTRPDRQDPPLEESAPPPVLRARPPVPFWRRPALPWALAAILALCVVGLAQRQGGQRQAEIIPLLALRANEEDATRGSADTLPTITGSAAVELPLPVDSPEFPAYDVEVVPASGGEAIPVGRESAPISTLFVSLPRQLLSDGEYRFQVYGIDGGRRDLIATFPFQVAAQP